MSHKHTAQQSVQQYIDRGYTITECISADDFTSFVTEKDGESSKITFTDGGITMERKE